MRVRVVPDVGGAFGTKNNLYPEELAIPLPARRLRRPVIWSRIVPHIASAAHGREHVHDVRSSYDDDGMILGVRIQVEFVPFGAYLSMLAHEEIGISLYCFAGRTGPELRRHRHAGRHPHDAADTVSRGE